MLAVCQARGIQLDVAPRIATAFGGGIAGSGATCGALVGAMMALGLHLGRESAETDPAGINGPARQIFDRFQAEMGSVCCRDLTGVDLRTTEGRKQHYESGGRERVCLRAAPLAARLAEEVLTAS